VGTTSWHVIDDTRRETLSSGNELREVEVLAWYPAAAPGGLRAPYLREGLEEVRTFARLLRSESAYDALASVETHASLDALPLAGASLPVVLFSHGYTGVPSAHTALVEDLASHGYAVLIIVHPYEATAATLLNGRVVSMAGADGRPLASIGDVFKEWASEDETMAAVTAADSEAEQLRLLRGYLATLHHTHVALRRWVDDTKLVADRLRSAAAPSTAVHLAGRLDLDRMVAAGHSMGGVTAAQFCVEDSRCRGALNLDGIPQYGTMIDTGMNKPFLMVYSARPGRAGASDAIYSRASKYYRVDVKDSLHLEFTDMVFWSGPVRERRMLGSISPARVTEITRAVVRGFFDEVLTGRISPILNGASPFAETSVVRTP
jgi:predicted dienelactone hydrolase